MYKCIFLILSSFYYLSSEFIAIMTSENHLNSYYKKTISYLGTYSFNYNYIMNLALIINGIFYYYCVSSIFKKGLPIVLSFFVGLGSIMVGLFHSGSRFMLLHVIGTCIVFVTGNVNTIASSFYIENKTLKIIFLILGSIGLLSGLFIVFFKNKTTLPILERLSVYPIVLFEIILPIYILANINKCKIL